MTEAALDRLRAAHATLDLALDGQDPAAVATAAEDYRAAIFNARAAGAWRGRPELARRAVDLLGRVEGRQKFDKGVGAAALSRHFSLGRR